MEFIYYLKKETYNVVIRKRRILLSAFIDLKGHLQYTLIVKDNSEKEYIKCYTCGKFIIAEDAYKNKFCSLTCSSVYSKCTNCGSFFEVKKGYSENLCSKECSTN